MKIRRFLSVFLLTCLLCALLTPQALALEDPDIHAKAAILVDGETGTVLYDKNMHEELPMASITKVMSALLVLEAVDRGQLHESECHRHRVLHEGHGGGRQHRRHQGG